MKQCLVFISVLFLGTFFFAKTALPQEKRNLSCTPLRFNLYRCLLDRKVCVVNTESHLSKCVDRTPAEADPNSDEPGIFFDEDAGT